MSERLYTAHPAVYVALYRSMKDYDTEARFMLETAPDGAPTDQRWLIVGCGPGEHARRLVDAGVEVVGVDPSPGMVGLARSAVDGKFVVGALPALPVDATFDVVIAPFTVIDHLPEPALHAAIDALLERVAPDGVVMFDTWSYEVDAGPVFRVHQTELGDIARLIHLHGESGGRLRWDSIVFVQDRGQWFLDSHELTDHDVADLRAHLEGRGLTVTSYEGFGTGNPAETVLVGRR